MEGLTRRLWHGALPDPAAPGRALLTRGDYPGVLAEARLIVRLALPLDLAALQARWPWSVDLGWLSVTAGRDPGPLAQAVRVAGRRQGALAWGLWTLGRPDEALACLDRLDPDSPSHDEDRRIQAELRILAGQPAELPPGPEGLRLSFLRTLRRHGPQALARRLSLEAAALPAHAPLWAFLVDACLEAADLAAAREALSGFDARLPGHPEVTARRIRLHLASERPDLAEAELARLGDGAAPWRWPLRRHLWQLRVMAARLARDAAPDYTALRQQAGAALRLFPRSPALIAQELQARELTEDWDILAGDLARHPEAAVAAQSLLRLGLPQAALDALDRAAPMPPDEAFRLRLRRAEALKMAGDLAAARKALGPVPEAVPLQADHAYWAAEIDAAERRLPEAGATLAAALGLAPCHRGLHLTAARVAFHAGLDAEAAAHLAAFRDLKTLQTGQASADDLRDLIARDAATQPNGPGAAARQFARATPPFQPLGHSPIPRRVAHYWEGPAPAGLERSLRAWGRLYPQRLFDAPAARDWLARHSALAPLFDRLSQPAARADLFRLALMAVDGGIFADLDEYPRRPVEDWLDHAELVLVIEEGHGTLANNFLAARPGLALFDRLCARVRQRLEQVASPYPWWDCGPAPLTLEALPETRAPGRRFLTQAVYDARVATNLPFAHKRGPAHWR